MKLKELIKKFEERKTIIGNFQGYAVWWEDVKEIFEQLDESETVTIPQFVADAIEGAREQNVELEDAFEYVWEVATGELRKWFGKLENRNNFARAWLDGYEVEKEKRYLVKIKATKHYFVKDGNGKIFFSLAFEGRFTKKELEEAGFGWVFSCEGIEIEEVE